MAWKLYTKINGVDGETETVEFNGTLPFVHRTDLSDNPQDAVLYWAELDEDTGDNQTLEKVEATNPGTNFITVSIVDAAVGSGHEADEIKLAKTSPGLDSAVAGASLDLGQDDASIGVVRLLSGVSQAQPIHIRVSNAVTSPGTSTELSTEFVDTIERAKST